MARPADVIVPALGSEGWIRDHGHSLMELAGKGIIMPETAGGSRGRSCRDE